MRRPAKVKFIGNPYDYKLACVNSNYKYCRDCDKRNCNLDTLFNFEKNKIYNAYFLEYWQGYRDNLHVKGEDEEVNDFIPFGDFEVIEDTDNVLSTKEAIVKCISHNYTNELLGITYGKEYRAIGIDRYGRYLVMDDSRDCYFYLPTMFEIVKDEHNILNPAKSLPIYDFKNFTE